MRDHAPETTPEVQSDEPREPWERIRFWVGLILGCGIMLALIWRDL